MFMRFIHFVENTAEEWNLNEEYSKKGGKGYISKDSLQFEEILVSMSCLCICA